ncbi:MAG: hypothetical protein N3D14_00840 [Aquificaceae bacterium]|nr:hypothetical protein [Aquificaceae bacterium]
MMVSPLLSKFVFTALGLLVPFPKDLLHKKGLSNVGFADFYPSFSNMLAMIFFRLLVKRRIASECFRFSNDSQPIVADVILINAGG